MDGWTVVTDDIVFASMERQSNDSDSEGDIVVMSVYWDEWSRCIGSRYQRDHLYRVGRLDSCSKQWRDFKIAGQAKLIQLKDPIKAKELIQSTYYYKRRTISPTAGAIWDLKEKPSWI